MTVPYSSNRSSFSTSNPFHHRPLVFPRYFLEQGMLSHFLNYMAQKNGRLICVQILQTLNILFENIRLETSLCKFSFSLFFSRITSLSLALNLDYLLSNNLVNRIIVYKFDFTDEEITAYYISFLKTLSFKLNSHSINFFYNDVSHIGIDDLRTICACL